MEFEVLNWINKPGSNVTVIIMEPVPFVIKQVAVQRQTEDDKFAFFVCGIDGFQPFSEDLKAAFGDFAPYMIATEASLNALNEELPFPVTMTRFRPNIVVSGLKAFEEDKWAGKIIKVGESEFRFLKHCGRCVFTTVNPALGEKDGNEPLHTLRRIRLPEDRDPRQGQSPLFGVHVAPEGDGVGVVMLGDSVMVSS